MDLIKLQKELLRSLEEDFKALGADTRIMTGEESGTEVEILQVLVPEFGASGDTILAEFFFLNIGNRAEDTLYFSCVLNMTTELEPKSMQELFEACAKLNFYLTGGSFAVDTKESMLVYRMMTQLSAGLGIEALGEQINMTASHALQFCEPYASIMCHVAQGSTPAKDVLGLLP